jgi:protein-serine/threonine kinase
MAILDSSEEITQNEGETDSPDKLCNVSEQQHSTLDVPQTTPISHFSSDIHVNGFATITPDHITNFSLPPPDTLISGDKQPGYTRGALQLAAVPLSEISSSSSDQHQQNQYLNQQLPSQSPSGPPSTLSSPTATSLTDSYWEAGSPSPSRSASQPASRAGSVSVGGKVAAPPAVHIPSWRERRGSKADPPPAPARKLSSASVHSDKGDGTSYKFNLKDLLANGPKLSRKSSQKSVSSRKSESEAGEGKARSTAGDSAVSLTEKYGVCQKVAIGKGATSVVRLAHKWDRTEEKLYAIKVSH